MPSNKFKKFHSASLLFVIVFFAGCATWSQHRVAPEVSGKFRIALFPIQSEIKITQLKTIRTVPKETLSSPNEALLAQEEFKKTMQQMNKALEEKLIQSGRFELLSSATVEQALAELGISTAAKKLNQQELNVISEKLNVRALLFVKLVGYGKIKKSWVLWLIGSSIPEAVAQGFLTVQATGNQWAAIGIAAEDVLQEIVQWGGGSLVFNRIFTPVVLESSLQSVADGKKIWHHTSFATINFKALKKLPKDERKKKEIRLQLASEKALRDLAKNLGKRAERNLKR